ncbi:MAG TPA: polysaccharide biosynthesis tyrosine autokinase [Acidimicrobiales bacterium]|nr:polysaccharide biosynthesis tyrosine autokinase [Acidimicrobiales bacterium]
MQPAETTSQTLRDYLRVVRRRKRTIALIPVLVMATAVGLSLIQPKIYEGKAEVLLQNRLGDSIFGQNLQQQQQNKIAQTEIRVLRSSPVRAAVRKKLGTAPKINASPIPETDLFEVRARSRDPETAAKIANEYVRSYIQFRRTQAVEDLLAASDEIQTKVTSLEKEIDAISAQITAAGEARRSAVEANLGPRRDALVSQQAIFKQRLDQLQVDASLKTGGAQLVTPAVAGDNPVSPNPVRNALLGLVFGLMLGLGHAFLFEQLDDSVKVKEDAERASGLPTLGLIPAITQWRRRTDPLVISVEDPGSPTAEAYRTLRTSISFIGLDSPLRTLQITSPAAGDGKSATVSNLGVALARAGQRVVIVGCDLRRPRLHQFFGAHNEVGFTNVVLGTVSLDKALQRVPNEPNLAVLASGPMPPNPSELLASHRAVEVLRALRARADIVLIDCPPILPVTDSAVLSAHVDATLLVVTANKSTRREVHRAVELLRQVDARLVGTVLNGVAEVDDHYGGYSYRYESGETSDERKVRREGRNGRASDTDATGQPTPARPASASR